MADLDFLGYNYSQLYAIKRSDIPVKDTCPKCGSVNSMEYSDHFRKAECKVCTINIVVKDEKV